MTAHDFDIAFPTEPGLYESVLLREAVAIRVNEDGSADAVVTAHGTTYETVILDLGHYASEFGPFRATTDDEPETPAPDDPDDPEAAAILASAEAQLTLTSTEEDELAA